MSESLVAATVTVGAAMPSNINCALPEAIVKPELPKPISKAARSLIFIASLVAVKPGLKLWTVFVPLVKAIVAPAPLKLGSVM